MFPHDSTQKEQKSQASIAQKKESSNIPKKKEKIFMSTEEFKRTQLALLIDPHLLKSNNVTLDFSTGVADPAAYSESLHFGRPGNNFWIKMS